MEKITLRGDNCLKCPRYLARTNSELEKVAQLWIRIGWKDKSVPIDKIKCSGCSSHKQCTYHLMGCTKENKAEKCNQCSQFPCHKMDDKLQRPNVYEKKCREVCTDEEYHMLKSYFLIKRKITKINRNCIVKTFVKETLLPYVVSVKV